MSSGYLEQTFAVAAFVGSYNWTRARLQTQPRQRLIRDALSLFGGKHPSTSNQSS
jgi:hypothetical protein